MHNLLCIALFLVGIILVIKGGDVFVDAASWIAKALNIPTFIIGATIVSIATTLPEMIVSAFAAAEGKTDMAIGNAVGSVIANIGLIMAVAMVAMNIVCSRKKYLVPMVMLIATSAILYVSSLSGSLSVIGSVVLGCIFVAFMTYNVISAKGEKTDETDETEKKEPMDKKLLGKNIVLFLIGAAAIVLGSRLMVKNGSVIATDILHVPERIVAITLIAIGTSLPELVTTVTAIIKKESALSIGNVIGANIIDLSLILPICSIVSGQRLPVAQSSIIMDLPVCLGLCIIALVPIMFREKASKVQGALLLICYAAYLGVSVFAM